MLHRLCGPPSIPLSFSLATVLPRRNAQSVGCATDGKGPADGWRSSFTAWTTRVSNPVRSPRSRASASGPVQRAAFASGVPPNIYEFHLYTRNSARPSRPLGTQSRGPFRGWAPGFHPRLAYPPARALRPVIPNNASPLRITAAAGTEFAGASSPATVIVLAGERALRP